ncbi:MAG: histidine kinase [Nocardioides sp.]|nr:histidine kinase [Nocardioides sp.]
MLARQLRFNVGALVASTVALSVVYVAGFRHDSVVIDIVVMLVSLTLIAASVPLARRYGPGAPLLGLTAAVTAFAFGGTWTTPQLVPLTAMLMMVPLFVGFPHLPRRWVTVLMVYGVLGSSLMSALAEYRRPLQPGEAWQVNAVVVAASVPTVAAVIAYLVNDAYRRMRDQAEALRQSSVRVVQVADAARRGIERDLHDGAQQRLLLMSVDIERTRVALAKGDLEAAEEQVAVLARENRKVVRELRELARGIYPPLLTERGLVPAVQAAARRAALPVTVQADEFARPPRAIELAAYFCIMEALNNAVKHSGASEVVVRLWDRPGLEFEVSDDGRGFDADEIEPAGLLGLRARVLAAGGTLRVRSTPGRGTTISGRFPDAEPGDLDGIG